MVLFLDAIRCQGFRKVFFGHVAKYKRCFLTALQGVKSQKGTFSDLLQGVRHIQKVFFRHVAKYKRCFLTALQGVTVCYTVSSGQAIRCCHARQMYLAASRITS